MDMLWKQAAIERLKLYEPKRLSLKSIPQEIRRLELEMQSIRSATSDGSPSKGGGSGREDMYLSNIVRREELECSLEQARIWVSLTDSALSLLNDEERLLTGWPVICTSMSRRCTDGRMMHCAGSPLLCTAKRKCENFLG